MRRSKPREPPPQGARPVPAEFDDVVSWVTWLYYADELTQSEIAGVLGVSRATVVKMLQEAREQKLVTVSVNVDLVSRTRAARALSQAFGLSGATVIPSAGNGMLQERLGRAGARVLAARIVAGDVIAVAWGRTVLSVARAMPAGNAADDLTVVQLLGSSPGSSAEFSPELCSSLLAGRLNARCANLLAPAVLSTAALRDQLLAEPAMISQFRLIHTATRVLFGIGDLGPGSTVRESELTTQNVIDAYVAAGAVGIVAGRFLAADGTPVLGLLDNRMIGLTLEELAKVPDRLCVAGGQDKVVAIRAGLRAGYVSHLVTDLDTADALLRSP